MLVILEISLITFAVLLSVTRGAALVSDTRSREISSRIQLTESESFRYYDTTFGKFFYVGEDSLVRHAVLIPDKVLGTHIDGEGADERRFSLSVRLFGEKVASAELDVKPVPRPPVLCPGCPHRGFFYTISRHKNAVVAGDIGCYTLGAAAPLSALDSCVCMGGGFTVAMGMAKAFESSGV